MLPKGLAYLMYKFHVITIFRTEMTVKALRKCIPGTRLDRGAEPNPYFLEKAISAKFNFARF